MRLTWKDAVSTLFMGAIVAVYLAFRSGTTLWLISSARGAITAVFILGFVGGCALSAAGDLYAGPQSRSVRAFQVVSSVLGIAALTAAIVGLVTGSTTALAVLVATTIALWLTATVRHVLRIPAKPGTQVWPAISRDVHEVIDQEEAGRH